MKKEYYVTHSKYKGNRHWENALTFAFEGKIKDVNTGIYNYYHNGELIWSEPGSADLWLNFSDIIVNNDYDTVCNLYPIYGKYSDTCDKYSLY